MAKRWLSRILEGLGRITSVLLLLGVWELLGRSGLIEPLILPAFSQVVGTLWQTAAEGELTRHLVVSVLRALTGFVLTGLLAVPLGLLMGWSRRAEEFFDPLVSVAYPVPKVALIPLFILWLGIGEASKLAVIAVAALFPLAVSTYAGVKATRKLAVWSALSMGATSGEILRKVVFPHALPQIFTGLRLSMAICWILLFSAEMVAGGSGLGYLMVQAENDLKTDLVMAGLIVIAVLGLTCDRLIRVAGARACRWYFAMGLGKVS
ncbi:MAG: ABC transporter permease [Deltaproteobacteria bacterium]|nr:ABC transporter permease [Deltaproteobacteria bacterium]MBI3079128.1 ABC transporter permease [Deltaproteobacteria bacterium]